MLSIRMKRLGRKGHPTYRVVVQDSRQSPTSGKYVAFLGSYDPHTKQSTLVKEKAEFYLKHGAQPSDRVIALFKTEKISLPKWVKNPAKKEKALKNPDKLRKNRPAGEAAPATEAAEQPEAAPEDTVETPPEETPPQEESQPENRAEQASEPEAEAEAAASDESSEEDKS